MFEFKIAGVVLGLILLLISALEHYANGVSILLSGRKTKRLFWFLGCYYKERKGVQVRV